jgi:hypothetical protein
VELLSRQNRNAGQITTAMEPFPRKCSFQYDEVAAWGAVGSVESAVWISCRCRWLIDGFELDGCEHAKRGVAALAVVEDLEVLEDRVGELDSGVPALAVEELDLHAAPE